MSMAELHGKISSRASNLTDRLEDLLTSDVFGSCKYLPDKLLLIPFLSTAKDLCGNSLGGLLPSSISSITYSFWPRLQNSEPDVLLAVHPTSGPDLLILIEAKYLSGKSGNPLSDEDLITAEIPRDQLAKQLADLKSLSLERERWHNHLEPKCCLVYVTAHRIYPRKSLEESQKEFKAFNQDEQDEDPPPMFWTSWVNLSEIVISSIQRTMIHQEKELLIDLSALLQRKGLVFFKGFSDITEATQIKWSYPKEITQSCIKYNWNKYIEYPKLSWHYKGSKGKIATYSWQLNRTGGFCEWYKRRRKDKRAF